MNAIEKEKYLKIALIVFGGMFCFIYPMGAIWPSGWVWPWPPRAGCGPTSRP